VKKETKKLIENLFLHPKPVRMLLSIKNGSGYTAKISKAVDCTYSHTVKVMSLFEKIGLVVFEKKGRIKRVKLTPEGEEIAHDFEGIIRKFSRLAEKSES